MKTTINLCDFKFEFKGFGHYKVTYTSPNTKKEFTTITNYMPLIDLTKNTDNPKKKDLKELKNICKNN